MNIVSPRFLNAHVITQQHYIVINANLEVCVGEREQRSEWLGVGRERAER